MKSFEQFGSADEALDHLAKEKERRQQEYEQRASQKNNRFFLKGGQEGHIVFLDDLWFAVAEHQFWDSNSKRPIFETCVQSIEGDCPGCESDNKAYFAMVTSVIHLDYEDKNGNQKPRKCLLVAKAGSAERILTRQKNQGTIRGKMFWVKRSNDTKSERTGTDIDFVKDADWEKVKKTAPETVDGDDWIAAYDYKEIFKTKSVQDFRKVLGIQDPVGGSKDEQPDVSTSSGESGGNEGKEQVNSLQDLI